MGGFVKWVDSLRVASGVGHADGSMEQVRVKVEELAAVYSRLPQGCEEEKSLGEWWKARPGQAAVFVRKERWDCLSGVL